MGIEEFLKKGDNVVLGELDKLTYLVKYKGDRVKINIF